MRFGRLLLTVLVLGFALRGGAAVAVGPDNTLPAAERAKIERLIHIVGQSTDRRFVRNGTSYDASIAARFLRAKWEHLSDRVRCVDDFIREIGSRAGNDGPPYRVVGTDGTEETGAAFLTRHLAKI
jgi:hypothetical protein